MTTKPSGTVYLAQQIQQLKEKEALQTALLKEQAAEMLQSLKPSSLLKSAFTEITTSKEVKRNVVDTSLGIGAGFVARKIFERGSRNIFKKMAGFLLQSITTGLVTKKMPAIRDKVAHLQTK